MAGIPERAIFHFSSGIPRLNDLPLTTSSNRDEEKISIRRKIRARRRALSQLQQRIAAINLRRNRELSKYLLRHKHVALYLSNDGEISPEMVMKTLFRGNKKVYLPLIHPLKKNTIVFCRFKQDTKLRTNRFGIFEPDIKSNKCLQPRLLSLVLFPLVAFDPKGNRMGMGGGFYDRAFSFKMKDHNLGPTLVGLAHDFQKQMNLPIEKWDIPLEGIVTDKSFYQ